MLFDVFDQPGVILVEAVKFRPVFQLCPVSHLQLFLLFEGHVDQGVDDFTIFSPPGIDSGCSQRPADPVCSSSPHWGQCRQGHDQV